MLMVAVAVGMPARTPALEAEPAAAPATLRPNASGMPGGPCVSCTAADVMSVANSTAISVLLAARLERMHYLCLCLVHQVW